jgi:2-C-methyl-D-erythritol 2,4-cyclodiphosphate synthase
LRQALHIVNIDATIIAEAPKLSPYTDEMCLNIASDCNILSDAVNVKATTTEKLGFTGRREGIAAEAVCLIQRYQI